MGAIQNSGAPDVYDLPEGSTPAAETELGSLPPAYTENQLWAPNPNAMTLLPFSHDNQGWHWAPPNAVPGLVNSAYNALVGPAEVIHGKNPITGEAANPNPLGVANDITANLTGLGIATGEANPLQMNTFGGLGANNVDLVGRKAAIAAEKAGVPKEQIFQDTNWFRDKDSQWKFEIPDEDLLFHPEGKVLDSSQKEIVPLDQMFTRAPTDKLTLKDIFTNTNLFKQYPELADIKIISGRPDREAAFWKDYNGLGPVIGLGNNTVQGLKEVISHELQHAVQRKEGFGTGGSPTHFLPEGFNEDYNSTKQKIASWVPSVMRESGLSHDDLGSYMNSYAKDKAGVGNQIDKDVLAFHSKNGTFDDLRGEYVYDSFHNLLNEHVNQLVQRNNAFQQYNRLAGEVESRNVEARLAQGISGDRSVFPWATPGYHPGDQTVLRGDRVPYQQEFFPVEHDPFVSFLTPVDHDPFGEKK